jgi:hypothetical protein
MAWVVVGGAAVVAGASLISAKMQADAAKDAAKTQGAAAQAGIDEQRSQFESMQKLLSPYVQAGEGAMSQQQAMMGLKGPEAQAEAMRAISESPEMAALTQQGENAILQQGSATGGLRGGNIQGALAQFRPQMLSSLINQQYGRLGGLTQIGQASAAGVGAAGMQTGQSIAGLYGQQGAAAAGAQMAAGQAYGAVPGALVQGGLMGYGLYNPQSPAAVNPAAVDSRSGYGAYSQVPGVF